MVSKFFAVALLSLILAPFTAPFPTCDFSTLVGTKARHSVPPARSARRVDGDAGAATPVPPLTRHTGRLRTKVLAVGRAVPPALSSGRQTIDSRSDKPPASPTPRLTVLRV